MEDICTDMNVHKFKEQQGVEGQTIHGEHITHHPRSLTTACVSGWKEMLVTSLSSMHLHILATIFFFFLPSLKCLPVNHSLLSSLFTLCGPELIAYFLSFLSSFQSLFLLISHRHPHRRQASPFSRLHPFFLSSMFFGSCSPASSPPLHPLPS